MASLRAKLFNFYMKRSVKSKPLHLIDPAILRTGADDLAPKKTPQGVTCKNIIMGGIPGERHSADNAQNGRAILYFHGGGYVFGSAKYARGLSFDLAVKSRSDIFSVDYRLAPEHQFPAAVEDAVAAYQWLLAEGRDPANIIFSGDSAGGGLALALLLSCKERGLPLPAGAVLFSPFTDLAATGQSLLFNEQSDVMFKKVYIAEGAKRYLGEADPKSPLASPLFADHSGLPPILTFVSKDEALYNDSTRLHEKLLAAGVDAKLVEEKGLAHIWPLFCPRFPEAGKTISQAADFIVERTT